MITPTEPTNRQLKPTFFSHCLTRTFSAAGSAVIASLLFVAPAGAQDKPPPPKPTPKRVEATPKTIEAVAPDAAPVIGKDVRDALTPLLTRLTKAEKLRTTVKMQVSSSVGDEIVGKNEGVFQLASEAPNKLSMAAKFEADAVKFVSNGERLFVELNPTNYIDLPAPNNFMVLVSAMPIQLGPQPEPMLSLSLAGLNPVPLIMDGLKSCEMVAVEGQADNIKTIRAIRPEGLIIELTFQTGEQPQPQRLVVDMTEMIRQTNNLQVPEGYSFKISYTFEQWDTEPTFSDKVFTYTPPEKAERFESVADYLLRDSEIGPHPLLGKPAPTFTARVFEGEEVSYDGESNKVVVLDFWTTWCGPCVDALPEMEALAKKFADKDVLFYAVNVGEKPDEISGFLETHELNIPVIVDPNGTLSNVFQANSIPQTVLIGKSGRIEAVHVGFDAEKSIGILEEEITSLLAGRKIFKAEEVESTEAKTEPETETDK